MCHHTFQRVTGAGSGATWDTFNAKSAAARLVAWWRLRGRALGNNPC